jgi:hypothetical protein
MIATCSLNQDPWGGSLTASNANHMQSTQDPAAEGHVCWTLWGAESERRAFFLLHKDIDCIVC